MSITAWVKVNDYSMSRGIVGKANNNTAGPYDFYLMGTTGLPYFWRGDGNNSDNIHGATAPTTGIWQHVAVTMKGTTVTHYLNGNANGTGNLSVAIADAGKPLIIGSRDDAQTRMYGQIDDVRVYNYALTQEQIKQVMNNGSAINFGQ
jgi:hypothetical protein